MKEKVGKFTGRIHIGVVAVVVRGVYVGLCTAQRRDGVHFLHFSIRRIRARNLN